MSTRKVLIQQGKQDHPGGPACYGFIGYNEGEVMDEYNLDDDDRARLEMRHLPLVSETIQINQVVWTGAELEQGLFTQRANVQVHAN